MIDLVCYICKEDFQKTLKSYNYTKKRTKNFVCSRKCATQLGNLANQEKGKLNLVPRFWSKVDKTPGLGGDGDCWEWTASTWKGYGTFKTSEGLKLAHRFAYELENGPINDPKMFVCHSCDNRKCVRIIHLVLGSQQYNNEDMVSKGRHATGNQNKRSKIKDDNQAREIYNLIKNKEGSYEEVADAFGVSQGTISGLVNGKSWKHLELEPLNPFVSKELNFALNPEELTKFNSKINKTADCWFWTGGSSGGYGIFYTHGRSHKAYRISYLIHKGTIAEGLLVRHLCHNKICINPGHLETGSHQDNQKDSMKNGGWSPSNSQYRLTFKQVQEIRELWATGLYIQKEIASKYEVSHWTVNGIVNNRARVNS